jgi:hypothetical protein
MVEDSTENGRALGQGRQEGFIENGGYTAGPFPLSKKEISPFYFI